MRAGGVVVIARLPDATLTAELDEARRQLAGQNDPRTATAEVRALHLVSVLEELQERRLASLPMHVRLERGLAEQRALSPTERFDRMVRSGFISERGEMQRVVCGDCGHRLADHGSVGCRFVAGPYRVCKCETAVRT
jgi:hypothetical protein